MRNLKKGFDILTKINFLALKKQPQNIQNSKFVPVNDFPLLESINPIECVIPKQRVNSEVNYHEQEESCITKVQ